MTSNGIPFQTLVFPPPRKVGTPDSADTPAPVKTTTREADANRWRSSAEIVGAISLCMGKAMVAEGRNTREVETLKLSSTRLFHRIAPLRYTSAFLHVGQVGHDATRATKSAERNGPNRGSRSVRRRD